MAALDFQQMFLSPPQQSVKRCSEVSPKGDQQQTIPAPYHGPLSQTTHASFAVHRESPYPKPPTSGPIEVVVTNGSDGRKVCVALKSTDTIAKLRKKFLEQRPEMVGRVNLVYNGKPVEAHQILRDLGVKAGSTFVTYQKCIGG